MEIHIHNHHHYDHEVISQLLNINQKLTTMAGELTAIKEKLALQDTAIDGLQADLDFIKGKLGGAEGGLSATEVAELNTLIDERTAKLQALDAQTDPSVD